MKKKLTKLLLLFILINSSNILGLTAQVDSRALERIFEVSNKGVSWEDDHSVIGNNYTNEEFMPAQLSIDPEFYPMRFNAFKDEMEIEKDGKHYRLNKNINYTVTFKEDHKTYKVLFFNYKGKYDTGFFVSLVDGDKYKLLLKERILYVAESLPVTGYDKYQPPTLKRTKDLYFYSKGDSKALDLPTSKKDFYAIFTEDSKNIKGFVKKNKYSIKEASDLIEIFNYYNSLK